MVLRVWQPISTAPKEGTILRLWDGRYQRDGSWKEDENIKEVGWFSEEGDEWSTGYYFIPLKPTHWMMLPKPPDKLPKEGNENVV
jgi:hypothetical protein